MNALIECKKVIESDRVSLPMEVKKELGVVKGDFISFSKNDRGQIVIQQVTA
jgi:bifunctional DNA-binding transcriptional regulator/antitoxin component of YhaV-PrlF toxin-antitoxin module